MIKNEDVVMSIKQTVSKYSLRKFVLKFLELNNDILSKKYGAENSNFLS